MSANQEQPSLYLDRLFDESPDRHRSQEVASRASSPALSLAALFEPAEPEAGRDQTKPVSIERPAPASYRCSLCTRNHRLGQCRVFRRQTVERRLRSVLLAQVCDRCFSPNHRSRSCPSQRMCAECDKPHHSLLHLDHRPRQPPRSQRPSTSASHHHPRRDVAPLRSVTARQQELPPSASMMLSGSVTLMPTAVVVVTLSSRSFKLRAIIDVCCPTSRITRAALRRLRCTTTGVGSDTVATLSLASTHDRTSAVTVLLQEVPELSTRTPMRDLPNTVVTQLANMKLADPSFHQRAGLDLVLGGNIYPKIVRPTVLQLPGLPLAQDTIFGWVLSGPCAI